MAEQVQVVKGCPWDLAELKFRSSEIETVQLNLSSALQTIIIKVATDLLGEYAWICLSSRPMIDASLFFIKYTKGKDKKV